jgi:hypothetical protein
MTDKSPQDWAEELFPLDGSSPDLIFTLRQAYLAGWYRREALPDTRTST